VNRGTQTNPGANGTLVAARTGVVASESFRSSLQQMVNFFDGLTDETAPATSQSGSAQAAGREAQKGGPLFQKATTNQAAVPIVQPPNSHFEQASAATITGRASFEHLMAPGTEDERVPVTASGPSHSVHAKPSEVDRQATAKSRILKTPSLQLNDESAAVAVPVLQHASASMTAKTQATGAPELPRVHPSATNADTHQPGTSLIRGSRATLQDGTLPRSVAVESTQNTIDAPADGPIFSPGEGSRSHAAIAYESSNTTADSTASAGNAQLSGQPNATSNEIQGSVPAENPASSTISSSSATDLEVASSNSSVSDASEPRAQAALAGVGVGSESTRRNSSTNSQLNQPVMEGVHNQPSAATVGVVRDVNFAQPANSDVGTMKIAHDVSTAETFSALDGAGGSLHPTWVHAGPHQAEAGFEDPALGWVSVRAGVNAGNISAVVVPGSADATQALGVHMVGLHNYLAEQHSPVQTLTLAGNADADAGLNQGSQQQGHHQSAQDNQANAQSLDSIAPFSVATRKGQVTEMRDDESPVVQPESRGGHISVMA
jgi:hypothetical protein